jgi:integrase
VKLAQKRAFFVLEEKPVPKNIPCFETKRKRFLKQHLPYKLPKIIRAGNGDWCIRYWYEYPSPEMAGKFKIFAVRDGINYIHDLIEKEKAAQQLCKDITYALEKLQYNPFKQTLSGVKKIEHKKEIIEKKGQTMDLASALSWYIITKKAHGKSTKTLRDYRISVQGLIDWYKPDIIKVDEVTIDDLEKYFNECLHSGKWSARTYNNNIAGVTTFFNYLVSKRKLKNNPIGKGMLETVKNTAEKNKYYNQATLDKVLPEIKKAISLRKYILWTYYTCARGTELKSLQIKHIDLSMKQISIMADNGKTGEHVGKRSIPICQELMDIINEDNLKTLPSDYYIFGKKGLPGPERSNVHHFSELYLPIKKRLNIDLNYTIYGFKHTRVVDLIMAGFEPITVMYLTGHTDWGSFQHYIRELGAVMNKKLIGNTLELKI